MLIVYIKRWHLRPIFRIIHSVLFVTVNIFKNILKMPKGLTDHLSKEIKNKYKFWNIYEINQINWDMKICCPKNNWISFDWIFKKYHAHSNYICTDLEGFASEKFKLFKSHSKISKKRPWTPPPPQIFKRGSFEAGKILSSSHFLRNKQLNSRQN